jgi:hypothetical protein
VKNESSSFKIRNKASMPAFTTSIQQNIGSPRQSSLGKKKK